MASRIPPKFVPTLTEVVGTPPADADRVPAGFSQEQLVQRVMQRVDLTLERRLREAIATTVLEQTRLLGPLLRQEIEAVVRESVAQALAEELAAGRSGQQRS
jgi:hypothetical protein